MHAPKNKFSLETLVLMGGVCDDAWLALNRSVAHLSPTEEQARRSEIASRVIAAVSNGERDPERLKTIALAKPVAA